VALLKSGESNPVLLQYFLFFFRSQDYGYRGTGCTFCGCDFLANSACNLWVWVCQFYERQKKCQKMECCSCVMIKTMRSRLSSLWVKGVSSSIDTKGKGREKICQLGGLCPADSCAEIVFARQGTNSSGSLVCRTYFKLTNVLHFPLYDVA